MVYDEETLVEIFVLRLIDEPSLLDDAPPALRRKIGDRFVQIMRHRTAVGAGNPDPADIHALQGKPSPWQAARPRGDTLTPSSKPGYLDLSHRIL